jgi:hypothetical protein
MPTFFDERLVRPVEDEQHPKGDAASPKLRTAKPPEEFPRALVGMQPLWQLDIVELTGHNLEVRGREEVNRLLEAGWRLLHIYTLKYREDDVWRERPMAILGRPRHPAISPGGAYEASSAGHVPEHGVVGDC